jgi:hypothetical protein
MKKNIFLVLFFAFSFLSNAQSDSFRAGLVAGFSPQANILETSPLNAGLMTEFTIPFIGVGAEVDMIYENKAFQYQTGSFSERFSNFKLPIYAKWKLGLPYLKGFLGAGATYSLSWKDLREYGISSKTFQVWSLSAMAGIELFNKLYFRLGYDYPFFNKKLKTIFTTDKVLTINIGCWF